MYRRLLLAISNFVVVEQYVWILKIFGVCFNNILSLEAYVVHGTLIWNNYSIWKVGKLQRRVFEVNDIRWHLTTFLCGLNFVGNITKLMLKPFAKVLSTRLMNRIFLFIFYFLQFYWTPTDVAKLLNRSRGKARMWHRIPCEALAIEWQEQTRTREHVQHISTSKKNIITCN